MEIGRSNVRDVEKKRTTEDKKKKDSLQIEVSLYILIYVVYKFKSSIHQSSSESTCRHLQE